MSDRSREAEKAPRATTILDPLRPAVVVRRRVYEATPRAMEADAPRAFTTPSNAPAIAVSEEAENGPPSSINVARALASLRADELRRVDEIVAADERGGKGQGSAPSSARAPVAAPARAEVAAPARAEAAPPTPPPVPTLVLGKTIALSELAQRMGVSSTELPATLVARGFYALTAKTVLPRETARVIAEMYGWRVEDAPPELEEAPPVKSAVRSRIARTPKARVKAKTTAKAKAKTSKVQQPAKRTKAKAAKRRLAR